MTDRRAWLHSFNPGCPDYEPDPEQEGPLSHLYMVVVDSDLRGAVEQVVSMRKTNHHVPAVDLDDPRRSSVEGTRETLEGIGGWRLDEVVAVPWVTGHRVEEVALTSSVEIVGPSACLGFRRNLIVAWREDDLRGTARVETFAVDPASSPEMLAVCGKPAMFSPAAGCVVIPPGVWAALDTDCAVEAYVDFILDGDV